MGQDITNFGAGLIGGTGTPVVFGQRVSIFASTRPEWQVTAQAAFEHGVVVVTVYPSLGPDALAYSLNQTEATHLVCQVRTLRGTRKRWGQLWGCWRHMSRCSQSAHLCRRCAGAVAAAAVLPACPARRL